MQSADEKNIGSTIRIGQEIRCLPYAGISYRRGFIKALTIFVCFEKL